MRWAGVVLLGVALSSAATASFDLMIVPDPGGNRYVRFDPVNRVALGSIAMDGARKVSAVSTTPLGIYQYASGHALLNNYTGEAAGFPSFNSSASFVHSPFSGNLLRFSNTSVSIGNVANPNTFSVASNWTVPSGVTVFGGMAQDANTWMVYGVSSTGLNLYLINNAGATVATATGVVAASNLAGGAGAIGQATFMTRGATRYFAIPYRTNTGAHSLLSGIATSSSLSSFGDQSISDYSTALSFTSLAAVEGHSGFFLVGADATNPNLTRISWFDNAPTYSRVLSYTTSSLGTTSGVPGWRMANIVAPEPGTLVALSAGLLACLRRKKRSG